MEAEKRWFEPIDENLNALERARLLKKSIKRYEAGAPKNSILLAADIEVLRKYARDTNSLLRALAVEFSIDHDKFDWEDLEKWALDTDADVRWPAIDALMCANDETIQWSMWLLTQAIRIYADFHAGLVLHWLATRSEEYLELTWQAAEEVLITGGKQAIGLITVCYFEHVVDDSFGPDHPIVASRLAEGDRNQKMALLKVADMGLGHGHLREIVLILAKDKNEEIADEAKILLAN